MSAAESTITSRGGKYLTFVLNNEQYGLEILKVKEILSLLPITPMPPPSAAFRQGRD